MYVFRTQKRLKQFPALVICVLDYPQFYWETLCEFGDYTGLGLVLYLFSFPYTVSNTTCHMEEQCFFQLNPIQKLLTQNCQPQWDEKEEMLTIWQIHYNLRPILHVSLNINMSTQRGKYNRSWLWLPSVIGRGTQQALVFWITIGPEKSTHQDTHSATYCLLEINCYTSLGIWILRFQKRNPKLPAALTNLSLQEKKKL